MLMNTRRFAFLLVFLAFCTGGEMTAFAETNDTPAAGSDNEGFVPLFNGKDLTGWTSKIRGQELGKDPKNTFRVKDGVMQVRYDNYDAFDKQFGHIFYESEFSHYILRLEYRFLGDKQIDGHPGAWAYMNSGVMIHGQDPETMKLNQDFPVSIEVQLLGQRQDGPDRTTANICTPGTRYVKNGKLIKAHCKKSNSKTFRGEQWVKLEIEVHGSKKIIHRINGEVVFQYEKPQLDDGTLLEAGTLSLQSESHACDFRNIEIKEIKR